MARWGLCTFDGQGGSGVNPASVYILYSDAEFWTNGWYSQKTASEAYRVDKTEIPTKTGYDFNGYYTTAGGKGKKVTDEKGGWNSTTMPSQNFTAYAYWTPHEYTLTLNANGGSVSPSSKSVTFDSLVGELPTPTKTGHSFAGWFTDPSGGTQLTSSTKWTTASNTTVYAHWTQIPVLTFDPNGGTVSTASKYCTTGQPIGDLPVPTFQPNRFLGWFTASTGGTRIEPTDTYDWTTDKTVYAHWEAPHTLTFNPTGGQTSEVSRSVFTGDTLGPLPTATKPGYFPDGWWTAEDGGEEVTPETVYTSTADTTVYAHWTLDEQWNLTFAATGGTVSPASKRVRPGNPVGELPEPEYGGRDFLGWFTQQTGGTQYTATTVFDLHQDLTLYAHWFRFEYTLRFDPNGGTVDETERTVTFNEPIGDLPDPAKYANTFLGWFTSRDGGEEWDENTIFEKTDDTTLYAHWVADPQFVRTISLNAEGGTVSPSTVSCTYGLPIDSMPIPEKSGKIFLGWFTTASGGTKYTVGMTCDWAGALTLHAHWSDDVFGNLTDWFGLETADGPLMLVGSTDGATRSVVETSHTGALAIQTADSSVGAFERGGILLNPVCTYRIRKSGTVQLKLGKAWAKTGSVKSGYMITSGEYATAADVESVLVVRAVANEGADAINMWNVNLTVNPDHIAQDPMNAVSGGGEMTECKTLVTCDPVVPMENGMPCASDVVHGKVVVTATTNAYLGESAPTARSPFIEINGVPPDETDVDFTTYAFSAERSL